MTITIPDSIAIQTKLNEHDLLIDIAVYLYEKKRLSIGKARKLAGLDLISFQKELEKREVFIHFDIGDLELDLKNLGHNL